MNNWPTKKLGELCEIKIGKTPRRGVTKFWLNGTLPWATISEIHGVKITDTNEKISEAAIKELNMSPYPKGTILYTFKLSIGRVAIAGFFIKDKKTLIPEWLFYMLPTIDYRPFLSNAVKGNTLNKSTLKLLPIHLPPLKIQKQIVKRMDKIAEAQKLNDELSQKQIVGKLSAAQEYPSSRTFGSLRGRQKTTLGAKIEIEGIVRQRIA